MHFTGHASLFLLAHQVSWFLLWIRGATTHKFTLMHEPRLRFLLIMQHVAGSNGTLGYLDGPAATALLKGPMGIDFDQQGNLLIAEL